MISRRNLFKAVFALAAVPALRGAAAAPAPAGERFLALRCLHTEETLETTYCRGGVYDPEVLERLHRLLRCPDSGEVVPIDVGVLDLLCAVKDRYGKRRLIHVVSGYRSPSYNERLRRIGRGVAAGSFHTKGQAIDFALPGVGNRDLARAARSFRAGGVGAYARFVHIDTGPVRSW